MTRAVDVGSGPFTPDEIVALFDGLSDYEAVGIAVSGGRDSMALLDLFALWRSLTAAAAALPVRVLTVDHRFRPESPAEADAVRERAQSYDLLHRTCVFDVAKPATALQASARSVRYRVMCEAIEELWPACKVALLVAHTCDDQAETVLMRLARGSGIAGLGAMARVRALTGDRAISVGAGTVDGVSTAQRIDIIRPLLAVTRARLTAHLVERRLSWCDDPSNEDRSFERVRVRAAAETLASLGLTAQALGMVADRARRADAALTSVLDETMKRVTANVAGPGVAANFDYAAWSREPEELRIRLLLRLLATFGGQSEPPRLVRVEKLVQRLTANEVGGAETIAGCIVEQQAGTIWVYREPTRAPLPVAEVAPGETIVWDRRFVVGLASFAPTSVSVVASADAVAAQHDTAWPDWAELVDWNRVPRRARDGLPVVVGIGASSVRTPGRVATPVWAGDGRLEAAGLSIAWCGWRN
ncbi:MAG: tRNA lysidine(34) synthetase TilS [Hyphomicrobiaceae bacterium]